MSRDLRLRRTAQAEYDAAVDRYEAEYAGRGRRFFASVEAVFDELPADPFRWPEVWPGVRLAPVHRWPYGVYYEVHADLVLVIAVFHSSRDPSVWQSRV